MKRRYAADLWEQPFYRFLDRYHFGFTVVLSIALYAAGGWSFVVWGIFVRLVLVYQFTWLVNSAAHTVGYRSFRTDDRSTNCWWVALLAGVKGGTTTITPSRSRRATDCAGSSSMRPG